MELATRGERFRAAMADAGLIAIPYVVGTAESVPSPLRLVALAGTLVIMVLQLYWVTTLGQTIGKRLVGVKIVKKDSLANGGFVTNVLLRGVVTGLLNLVPLYFLVDSLFIFREDRRCIHDYIAGTCVIKA
jgi:uncharacterized RDD family membrane protein YckC